MRHPTLRLISARGALCAAACCAAALLAGCFDSDDGVAEAPPVADTGVPASATASPRAYTQFAGSLAADDRAAPRHLEGVEPPTSETAEPEPVS
jgi:hypothetical protein